MPNLFVIAGPNGAGKSTSAPKLLTGSRRVAAFVNADDIAVSENVGEIEAGRIMLRRLDELARHRQDFAIETTLASRSLRPRIDALQKAGYFFFNLYMPIADAWQMTDNSERGTLRLIASRDSGGPIRIENPEVWQRLSRGAMKPIHKVEQQLPGAPAPVFRADEVIEAMQLAVSEAIARHKALGQSIVIWRDGKVVVVPPEEIEL